MLDVLQELVFVVNQKKLGNIELPVKDTDSPLFQLYDGLYKNEFTTDEDAIHSLFQDPNSESKYQKLKCQLKGRLLDYLFLIDLNEPHYNERQRAYYECYKNWAAVKILLGKEARVSAINVSLNILRQAQRFEFTELAMDIARILRLHYGTRKGNHSKFEKYNALFKEYEKLWILENKAEGRYTELVLNYVNSKEAKPDLEGMAATYYQEISKDLENADSYRLRFSAYFIHLTQYMSKNDYVESIKIAKEAIVYFKKKDYQATTPLLIFAYQLLVCYTQLKKYEEGKEVVNFCQSMIREGSFNWFKFQENYFLLAMHNGQYQQAYHILYQAYSNARFQYLPPSVIEVWKIFEAYIHYLIMMDNIKLEEASAAPSFRLSKFLNEIPIYSKDKRGMNISILVIQILLLIRKGHYERAADRIESVRKYAYRYLTNDHTYRSNCFIKMLCKLPPAHYHKVAVCRKTETLLEKLKLVPLDIADQAHDIEVIPYEQLWEFTLRSLDASFHRSRTNSKRNRSVSKA
jgi:hypothetical protein